MAIAGELSVFNFVDVFQVIKKDKKDGILVIEKSEGGVFAIYFKEGDILYIRDVKKAFYVYLDIDFMAVLKKDNITKEQIYQITVSRLPNLLAIKEGKFSFTSGFIKYSSDMKPQIPTEKLIMYLSRQLSPEEVDRKISDLGLIFEKSKKWEEIAKKAYLTDIEKKILHLIDGKNTVADLIEKLKLPELTVKRALYGFLASEIIGRHKPEKRKIGFDLTKSLLKKIMDRIRGL